MPTPTNTSGIQATINEQAKLCLRLLRRSEKASISYNRDCNKRFLGRGQTDARRERLRIKSVEAFETMVRSYRRLADVSARAKKTSGAVRKAKKTYPRRVNNAHRNRSF